MPHTSNSIIALIRCQHNFGEDSTSILINISRINVSLNLYHIEIDMFPPYFQIFF
jgi:hypothetical protein